ncbi:hypothetical protein EOK75_14500 (plasmid) [Pseudorhodobacter turbinis]|uniref:DUF4231 domain-containing protein n=1 Tax=Pseudorhodobacter turbinis TaxID=2500533 RepID=A0A4P8EIN4_9RHOB|nr:hypothetical protein [Pseudorhodobacter turbinis]QCO57001.1 hypothetical protein EOK75_14500 [Pseudorhodobacter turbinis]
MGENERIAYELAYGQLRSQKADLQFFRGQASFAAAISGLIASVFSSIAGTKFLIPGADLAHSFLGIGVAGWLVISCFALSITFAVKAFMNWKECTFDLNPATAIYYADRAMPHKDLLLRFAADADKFFDKNERVIEEARGNLRLALIFACCQVPAWLVLTFS